MLRLIPSGRLTRIADKLSNPKNSIPSKTWDIPYKSGRRQDP